MPMNLGFFFIRKPRVSQFNAIATRPPTSLGTYSLRPAFSIYFSGSGHSSASLSLTGSRLQTLIDEDYTNSKNINIEVSGKTIQELVDEINNNSAYSAQVLTPYPEDICLVEGLNQEDVE